MMNDKERIFCEEYLKDMNATRAYSVAYPKAKARTCATNGYEKLRKTEIKKYIDETLEKMSQKRIATAEDVMKYLTSVMNDETDEEVIVVEGTGDGCSEARKVLKKSGTKERIRAAELIGKRYSLFVDKVDNSSEEEKTKAISNIENILQQMAPVSDEDVSD